MLSAGSRSERDEIAFIKANRKHCIIFSPRPEIGIFAALGKSPPLLSRQKAVRCYIGVGHGRQMYPDRRDTSRSVARARPHLIHTRRDQLNPTDMGGNWILIAGTQSAVFVCDAVWEGAKLIRPRARTCRVMHGLKTCVTPCPAGRIALERDARGKQQRRGCGLYYWGCMGVQPLHGAHEGGMLARTVGAFVARCPSSMPARWTSSAHELMHGSCCHGRPAC